MRSRASRSSARPPAWSRRPPSSCTSTTRSGKASSRASTRCGRSLQVPIKIFDRISYDVRARDLSVEVAKAKAVGADLLMPITRVSDAILMIREMVKQNWSPMGIISPGSPGPYEKAFTDALGKYADGYMSCVPWYDPTKKRSREIAAPVRARDRRPLRPQRGLRVRGGRDRSRRAQARQRRRSGRHPRRAQDHQHRRPHHLSAARSASTRRGRIRISAA